jgi:hypothetical protein
MQSLSASTATCEAGPDVEKALRQAFRSRNFAPATTAEPSRFSPVVPRLSRWFEVGAYVGVAAALLIAMFLGYRLVHPAAETPVASRNAGVMSPVNDASTKSLQTSAQTPSATAENHVRAENRRAGKLGRTPPVSEAGALTDEMLAKAGYTELMLCDPLSCSSEAQVVRMELPAKGADARDAQTVTADVVVGDDGLVRAIRIVN